MKPVIGSMNTAPVLQQADRLISRGGNQLGGLLGPSPVRRANGGKVGVTNDAMKLVKNALEHLYSNDASSARQALRTLPDPTVQEASSDLTRGPGGIKLAIRKLENLVRSFSDREQVPMLAKGGKVSGTIAAIRQLGLEVKRLPDTGEFRVNLPKGNESTAYYTDNAEDAMATAKAMLERSKK